jgi:hypothetical protein
MMIPKGKVRVKVGDNPMDGKVESIEYLTMGYKAAPGENRKRVLHIFPGMDGKNLGSAVSTVDYSRGEFLSEYALLTTKVNQFVLQYKQ